MTHNVTRGRKTWLSINTCRRQYVATMLASNASDSANSNLMIEFTTETRHHIGGVDTGARGTYREAMWFREETRP